MKSRRQDSASAASCDSGSSSESPENFRRSYIKEGPAILTTGSHSHERYLFLFNDLLLVAKEKERASNSYKLKDKIRLGEVWLKRDGFEAVAESIPAPEKSFVIGWPTANYVIQFASTKEREAWYDILEQTIALEKDREYPKITTVKVQCKDARIESTSKYSSGNEKYDFNYATVLQITNQQTAQDLFCRALDHFGLLPHENDYQLWVYSDKEGGPYPLIGHECPFAILLSHVRDVLPDDQAELSGGQMEDLASCHLNHKCLFIIRPKRVQKKLKTKKPGTTSLVTQIKRRMMSKQESVDSALPPSPSGKLFGHSLASLCAADKLPVPKAVMDLLIHLIKEGLFCKGIFRLTPKATAVRELRERLDLGETVVLDKKTSPYVTASVLKDFLRSLPDSLLVSEKFNQWMMVLDSDQLDKKLAKAKQLLGQLPKPNYELLRHLMCLLHHTATKQSENKMTSLNLAICFGYTLLLPQHELTMSDNCKRINEITQLLIEGVDELFGRETFGLLGAVLDRPLSSQESEEDSDSIGILTKQDTSSVDSLIGVGPSPVGSRPPSSQPPSLVNSGRMICEFTESKDSGLENAHITDERESEVSSAGHPRCFSQSDDTEEEFFFNQTRSGPLASSFKSSKSLEHLPGSLNIPVDSLALGKKAVTLDNRRASGQTDMTASWCVDDLPSPDEDQAFDLRAHRMSSPVGDSDICLEMPDFPAFSRSDPRNGQVRNSKKASGILHRSESGEHLVINETVSVSLGLEDDLLRNSIRAPQKSRFQRSNATVPSHVAKSGANHDGGIDYSDAGRTPLRKPQNMTLNVPIDSLDSGASVLSFTNSSASERSETPFSLFQGDPELSRHSITRKPARHRKGPAPVPPSSGGSPEETTSDSAPSVTSSLSSLNSSLGDDMYSGRRLSRRQQPESPSSSPPTKSSNCTSSIVLQCNNSFDEQAAVTLPIATEAALTYIIGAGCPNKHQHRLHTSSSCIESNVTSSVRTDLPLRVLVTEPSPQLAEGAKFGMSTISYSPTSVSTISSINEAPPSASAPPAPPTAHQALGFLRPSPFIPFNDFMHKLNTASLGLNTSSSSGGSEGTCGSSTVTETSSEESTPHVSRENSRAQELEQKATEMFPQKKTDSPPATARTGLGASLILAAPISRTLTEAANRRRSVERPPLVRSRELFNLKPTDEVVVRRREIPCQTELSMPNLPPRRVVPTADVSLGPRTPEKILMKSAETQTGDQLSLAAPALPQRSSSLVGANRRLPSYQEAVCSKDKEVPASASVTEVAKPAKADAQTTTGIGKVAMDPLASSQKLNIPIVPPGQVRSRIKRYDRENLRRKTLGGVEFRKPASEESQPATSELAAKSPLERQNSCERLSMFDTNAERLTASRDADALQFDQKWSPGKPYKPVRPVLSAANGSADENSNGRFNYISVRETLPEVSWSVQQLKKLYSNQPQPTTVAVAKPFVSRTCQFKKDCDRDELMNASASGPSGGQQLSAILRPKASLSATNSNRLITNHRYSSYEQSSGSSTAGTDKSSGNISASQTQKSTISTAPIWSRQRSHEAPLESGYRYQPLLTGQFNGTKLSDVEIVECPGNYPVVVPPPLSSVCGDRLSSYKPLRLTCGSKNIAPVMSPPVQSMPSRDAFVRRDNQRYLPSTVDKNGNHQPVKINLRTGQLPRDGSNDESMTSYV